MERHLKLFFQVREKNIIIITATNTASCVCISFCTFTRIHLHKPLCSVSLWPFTYLMWSIFLQFLGYARETLPPGPPCALYTVTWNTAWLDIWSVSLVGGEPTSSDCPQDCGFSFCSVSNGVWIRRVLMAFSRNLLLHLNSICLSQKAHYSSYASTNLLIPDF